MNGTVKFKNSKFSVFETHLLAMVRVLTNRYINQIPLFCQQILKQIR